MLHQPGLPFAAEGLTAELTKFDDLLFYDGPLLSHYVHKQLNKHYLFHWVDNDETSNRWLVLEVSMPHLFDYLSDDRSLHDIIKQPYNTKLLVVDTNSEGQAVLGLLVDERQLHADYVPEPDSYYEAAPTAEMPAHYQALFAEANTQVGHALYLEELRAKAVRFRLEPVDASYGTTLAAADIGSFLQRVTRSFRSFLEARFLDLFREKFIAGDEQKALSLLLNASGDPRAVFANHGSFEIDLAVDVLHLAGLDYDIILWQRQALREYKRDVFDFDFSANNPLPESLANATEEQLRGIFLPLVQIANSQNYNVQTRIGVTDKYKILKQVSRQNARKVVPAKPQNDSEEQLNTVLTNVLFELQEGRDPRTLTLSELRRAVVSVTTGDESATTVTEFVDANGTTIVLREPIEVTLSRTGEYFQAIYEPLGIDTLGVNARAALEGVERELRRLLSMLQQYDEEPNQPIGEKIGRKLQLFRELL
ncbi:hypothetical protein [Hymenobacter canadensis]|uniref:Uncharacterized protein n=1 Tax=Hymenobacter canadensis TaxID=2999067 RepID=A0ABY7LRA6_9BACT|nr:hypothetical protein [Hymenobacter canadensis]WBA42948.1 hypothetical protein O3303_05140 [Hymenobacter canadensis]